jgi:hypothetical protein
VAQQVPLSHLVQNRYNSLVLNSDTNIFTGFRAIDWLEAKRTALVKTDLADSVFGLSANLPQKGIRHLAENNWIQAGSKDLLLTADPYIDAALGYSSVKKKMLSPFSIGARLQGTYKDQFSFNFDVITNSLEMPAYVDAFIASHDNAVPGLVKKQINSSGRYNFTYTNFAFSYVPNKHFAATAGYGKQFIGDGYRSLLLSDNAYNYPYLRLKASFWKLTYNVIYGKYKNDKIVDGGRQTKYSVSHYLGINIGKKMQLGFFENILWLAKDTNFNRGFDVQYINPMTFMRPIEYSLGSPDNAFLGFTGKYKFSSNVYAYTQLGFDDLNIGETLDRHQQHINNKYFLQLGAFAKDLFRLRGLSWRLEWNTVRPYTYGHRRTDQNYTHNHQALTHPFQANFHEFISIINYTKDRWYANLENLYTIRGENAGTIYNNGEDLWGGEGGAPTFGSTTMQGIKHRYAFSKLTVGYLLNPRNRLALQADVAFRNHNTSGYNQHELLFSVGIRTGLFNFYSDF